MKTTILPARNWLEPYPRTFIIPMTMAAEMRLELRELTVGAFLVAVARNAAWRVLYRIRELAWRIGFLDFDEARCGEEGYHGDWRWRWWAPRISTKLGWLGIEDAPRRETTEDRPSRGKERTDGCDGY